VWRQKFSVGGAEVQGKLGKRGKRGKLGKMREMREMREMGKMRKRFPNQQMTNDK
jgi:hypothetical protein